MPVEVRYQGEVVGHKFSIGAAKGDEIVGVVIVGRPVSRHRDDGLTLEVTRLCTNGARGVLVPLWLRCPRCVCARVQADRHIHPQGRAGDQPSGCGLASDCRDARTVVVGSIPTPQGQDRPHSPTAFREGCVMSADRYGAGVDSAGVRA